VKNSENDDVEGDVGCDVTGGAMIKTKRASASDRVPGERGCRPITIRAETRERVLFLPP